MTQRYRFTITGMTCHACSKLITMDLIDSGLTPLAIDHESGILEIDLEPIGVDRIKDIINQSEKYRIADVQTL